MSAGRNKRRVALRGEEAEREAKKRELRARGVSALDLSDDELAAIVDARPIGRDEATIAQFASICTRCGKEGHHAKVCPDFVCHVCGEPGHKARRCPKAAT